jgi:hypothetical protein
MPPGLATKLCAAAESPGSNGAATARAVAVQKTPAGANGSAQHRGVCWRLDGEKDVVRPADRMSMACHRVDPKVARYGDQGCRADQGRAYARDETPHT